MSLGDAKDKYKELKDKMKELEKAGKLYGEYLEIGKEKQNLENLINAYENSENTVKQCTKDKKEYESDYALFVEGKYNEIGKTITNTTKEWTNSSIKEIQNSIKQQQEELDKYKQIYETTGSEVAQQQMQQAQQNLQNLADELVQRTKTIGTLGAEETLAWRTLANNSYEEYKNALSKVGPATQQEIQKATGVIVSDTGLEAASGNEAYSMTTNFENKLKLGDRTKAEISNTKTVMNNDNSIASAAENLGNDVDTNFNNKLDGWTWGWDLVKNIYNGLTNTDSKNLISKGASAIGSIIDSFLGFSLPEKGPLSDFDKSMPDMMDLMEKGIKNNKSKVINSAERLSRELYNTLNNDVKIPKVQDFGKFQKNLNNQIIDSTKTIFTTPNLTIYTQEFDARKIANEVNRIFGSQY